MGRASVNARVLFLLVGKELACLSLLFLSIEQQKNQPRPAATLPTNGTGLFNGMGNVLVSFVFVVIAVCLSFFFLSFFLIQCYHTLFAVDAHKRS